MKKFFVLMVMVLAVAISVNATLPTVTATLKVSNADGTFPSEMPDVTCSVTYMATPNPTPIIYSPSASYSSTTGFITWTVPQNSYIKVGCKACYGFTTPSNYAIATSNVVLNDMVASTPPSISSVNTFATIDCPSGTDPVADTAIDTLTFTAGTGLTITGDSTADSVTFANTATLENVTANGGTTAADITMQVGAATLYEPDDTGGSMVPISYSIHCVRRYTGPEGDLKYLNIDPVAASVPPHQIGQYGMYSGSFYAYRTTEWPGKIGILKNDTIAGESLFLANPFAVSGTAYTFNTDSNLGANDKIVDFQDAGTSALYITGGGNGIASGRWTFQNDLIVGNTGDTGLILMKGVNGATTYTLTLSPNAAMTENYTWGFPAAKPTGKSFLKMGTDGVVDYDASSYLTAEVDGVVGNEVTDTNGTTLTRSGTGTSGDPYTLGLNLGNGNTWTVGQVIDGTADENQLRIQSNSTQNAYPFVVENSAGTDTFYTTNSGSVWVKNYLLLDAGVIEQNTSGTTLTINGYQGSFTGAGPGVKLNTPPMSGTTASTGLNVSSTNTKTANAHAAMSVTPTYNQASGTASATDVLVNRTETAIGTGEHLLMDLQTGGVSKFSVSNGGLVVNRVKAITIPDSGDGNPAAYTITPEYQSVAAGAISSYIELTCLDANGCNITMGETEAIIGSVLNIVNMGTNVCNFADTPGVSELAGAFAEGQYDSLSLRYATGTWVETGRSDN